VAVGSQASWSELFSTEPSVYEGDGR